jgi:hypothetical protein
MSYSLTLANPEKRFGQSIALITPTQERGMGQEVSVSYQAVKSKVYKLIDALVEDAKTQGDVQESMKRWWKLIHPADRPVARKYLLTVLAKSNASLEAISEGLGQFKDFEGIREPEVERLAKIPSITSHTHLSTNM